MSEASTGIAGLLGEAAAGYGCPLAAAQADRLAAYVALVGKWGRIANLTGNTEPRAFAREQVVDCLAVLPHAGRGRLLDIGSGNGLPGVVLAIARPDLHVTLLEPRTKRARFLTQVRIDLGLSNVEVVNARVEAHHPAAPYDTLMARAVASLPALLAAARHLLHADARLVVMKGHLEASELTLSGLAPQALEVLRLAVPGYAERHLLIVHGGRLATADAAGFVP